MFESKDILRASPSSYERKAPERAWASAAAMALAVSAVFAGAVGCGKTSAGGDAAAGAMQAMPVQVQVAKTQKIPDETEYLSILKSRNSSIINPQVEGYITKIFVKSGDRVKPGEPLLQDRKSVV